MTSTFPKVGTLAASVCLCGLYGLLGCGSDSGGISGPVSANTYWALELNQHAVTMALTAPYDTMHLHAVPTNVDGDSLASVGIVTYTTPDTCITVDAQGLVTARYNTTSRGKPAYVIASLRDSTQNITHADTAFIQVTPTVPTAPLTTFSIQLPSDDSAKRAVDYTGAGFEDASLTPTVLDSTGAPMNSVLVDFQSSDLQVVQITRRTVSSIRTRGGNITPVLPGHAILYASAWVYGVTHRDSLPYTITEANNVLITIASKTLYSDTTPTLFFYPKSITIGVGGVVTWDSFENKLPMDVIFDDPINVDSAAALDHPDYGYPYTGTGSFTNLYYDQAALDSGDYDTFLARVRKARRFPVAGVYHYHSAKYGSTGTIIVE